MRGRIVSLRTRMIVTVGIAVVFFCLGGLVILGLAPVQEKALATERELFASIYSPRTDDKAYRELYVEAVKLKDELVQKEVWGTRILGFYHMSAGFLFLIWGFELRGRLVQERGEAEGRKDEVGEGTQDS